MMFPHFQIQIHTNDDLMMSLVIVDCYIVSMFSLCTYLHVLQVPYNSERPLSKSLCSLYFYRTRCPLFLDVSKMFLHGPCRPQVLDLDIILDIYTLFK